MSSISRNGLVNLIVLVAVGVIPLLLFAAGKTFYLDLATRMVCLAIAAVSLNLILGYGGMVSFGHAVFIGIGAYAVGIPAYHATNGEFELIASYNGFLHILLAVIFSSLFALVTGAISLRTKGIYFIMITMAFGQMIFFFIVSLDDYGGDDGLTIDDRSVFPLISLDNSITMFLTSYVVLVAVVFSIYKIVNSRFGMVLQGAKDNEERMRAMGYNTFKYRLTAYVIAGAFCGLSGALLGNFTTFISPEMIDWTRSGELIFMVLLGGSATLVGPVVGAAIFVVLEEVLSSFTIYWHLPFGIMLILSVLFARKGLLSLFLKGDDK